MRLFISYWNRGKPIPGVPKGMKRVVVERPHGRERHPRADEQPNRLAVLAHRSSAAFTIDMPHQAASVRT